METWLWWSTGKDSAWALHALRQDGGAEVTRLITTATAAFGRVAIHGTRLTVLEAQAESVGVPVEILQLPYPCSNEQYEAAVAPVVSAAAARGARMAFGDLHLEDVRAYRERLLDGTGVEPVFPIWGEDTGRLARAMVEAGLRARVTSLDPEAVPRSLAGASFDADFLDALPSSVDACGERGEFHTCAVDGPMFSRRVRVRLGEVVEREGFVYADLVPASEESDGPT